MMMKKKGSVVVLNQIAWKTMHPQTLCSVGRPVEMGTQAKAARAAESKLQTGSAGRQMPVFISAALSQLPHLAPTDPDYAIITKKAKEKEEAEYIMMWTGIKTER